MLAIELELMASSSSSHQRNQEFSAFSVREATGERRLVCESSKLFDVFINHRGPDVKGTLAIQLYNSLQQLGIEAFLDSEEKELGNSFLSIIETAIHSAKVHIAIFSKRYAESPWCLNELVLMLESTAKIIPVFYQVKPSDLRHIETGVYAEAFSRYKEKGRYLEKLNAWEEALQSLSLIAGEEFHSDWDCKEIVAAVQKEVKRKTCLHVAEYPVGLSNLVEDFEERCLHELVQDFESQCGMEEGKHKAQVVGIFGMGGVGKTTLAKELYNRKGLNYRRRSFLFDVREKSVTSQLPSLQAKLIKDLLGKEISFTSTEEGTAYLKDCLRRSPILSILIVVDDIDHVEQLNALAIMDILKKSDNCLVIITTRDTGVLINAGITVSYNIKGLNRYYARELFCWHAFRQARSCNGYEVLVEDFVDVCGGLPLSLQVLGSHVHGRPQSYWSSELNKVKKTLPVDVKQRLLISFDALDGDEKQVFLDIACFFVGKQKSIAERVWEASGWDGQHALQTLKDKCLVEEIEDFGLYGEWKFLLRMHDHLRDLGREMAAALSPPHRPWRPQDLKALKLMGFKTILTKTNIRCFSSIFDESMGSKVTFFLGQSESCLEMQASLLWLQLEGNSKEQTSIPSWIPLQNLQCLKIHFGQLKTLWEKEVQAPFQLRELKVSQTSLKEFPDLLGLSDNLEDVFLDAGAFPIQGLPLLECLSMNFSSLCLRFSTLKGEQACTKRGERVVCKSLVVENFKINGELDWNSEKAPVSGLEKLEINGEKFISKISISGIHTPSLESIKLYYMENLREVDLTRVNTLNFLDIRNCPKLKRLAATSDLPNLSYSTSVSGNPDLRNLPGLKVKNCTDFVADDHFSSVSGVSGSKMLAQLKISECQGLEELRLGYLSCVEKITIEICDHLTYLCFSGMTCLESITFQRNVMVKYFELDDCQNLRTFQFGCEQLVELSIQHCPELKELPAFEGLSCLERLVIDGCKKLKYLQLHRCPILKSISGNSEIRWLHISDCPELEELPSLSRVSSMEKIEIYQCEKMQNISLPTSLTSLSVESCRDLRTVASGDILELTELTIGDCPELEELSCLSRVNNMEKFEIYECEKIQNIQLPSTLVSLSVESCRDLQMVAGSCLLNNEVTPFCGLEKREISNENTVSKISINGIHYPRLESIKLHHMEHLMEVDLIGVKTLNFLDIRNCPKLKRLATTSDLPNLVLVNISQCPQLKQLTVERMTIVDCKHSTSVPGIPDLRNPAAVDHSNSVSGVSGFRMLAKVKIGECQGLEKLRLGYLSCVEKITIENCSHLKYLCFSGMKCLESITLEGDVMVKYFELDDCENLKTFQFGCEQLVKLSVRGCPDLKELPAFECLSCLERLVIDGCRKLKYLQLHRCPKLKSISGDSEIRWLHISDCPELEELPSLSRVSGMEKIEIFQCEKIQNISLPTALTCLSVKSCRNLRTVASGDILVLRELTIGDCPELEELSCLLRVKDMEKFEIYECEKIQNIRLPSTLVSLSIESCRDLQIGAGSCYLHNETASLSGLERQKISDENSVSKISINGIHYPRFESLKLHHMENLMEVDLTGAKTLNFFDIRNCPKLERLATSDLPNLVLVNISQCSQIKRLTVESMTILDCKLSTSVSGIPDLRNPAAVDHCNNVSGASGFRMPAQLKISECQELEELSVGHLSCLDKITIKNCNQLKYLCISGMKCLESITLEGNVMIKYFELDNCQNLKTMQFGYEELVELSILGCSELEELPALRGQNCLERIVIDGCVKFKYLEIYHCRNLKSVSGNSIRWLHITSCPELDEVPNLSSLSCLERIKISQCERIQNLSLPRTLLSLVVENCRDLRTVTGTGDIRDLTIIECPELEELPSISSLSCLQRIVINSCKKLQNIAGIEQSQASNMRLVYCSNALIRNSIHKLKRPLKGMVVIGRPVDGAESSLNENLFHEVNIGVDGVGEIGMHQIYSNWSELSAFFVCLVITADSSTSVLDINQSLRSSFLFSDFEHLKVREGEWIITMVEWDYWVLCFNIHQIFNILRRHGILKKGIWVKLKKDEVHKSVQVLSTIVDRLYHS